MKIFLCLVSLVFCLVGNSSYGADDSLTAPAPRTGMAQRSVLLDITRTGSRLVAVGERGIIISSDDDGATWQQAAVPVSVSLCAVRFADAQNGWAVGHSGVILHSSDGGKNWIKQLDGIKATELLVADAEAWNRTAPGDAGAAKAVADAHQFVEDGPDKPFLDAYFTDPDHGYVIGAYGLIFRTEDGGTHWLPWLKHVDNPLGLHLYALRSLGNRLILTGEQGYYAVSTDNGEHFDKRKVSYDGTFFGALATDNNAVILFGLRGTILRNSGDNISWDKISAGEDGSLQGGVRFADRTILLVSDRGHILTSHDEGQSFTSLDVPALGPLSSVVEAADGGIIVVGTQGVTKLPALGSAHAANIP